MEKLLVYVLTGAVGVVVYADPEKAAARALVEARHIALLGDTMVVLSTPDSIGIPDPGRPDIVKALAAEGKAIVAADSFDPETWITIHELEVL